MVTMRSWRLVASATAGRLSRTIPLVVLLITLPDPAYAHATVFVGETVSSQVRPTVGVSVGYFPQAPARTGGAGGQSFVGWEIEYAHTVDNGSPDGAAMGTFGGGALVQLRPRQRTRWYLAAGLGVFSGSLPGGRGSISFVQNVNIGGGMKFRLKGPLVTRVDYRLFPIGPSQ
jgi:hypothetical protein